MSSDEGPAPRRPAAHPPHDERHGSRHQHHHSSAGGRAVSLSGTIGKFGSRGPPWNAWTQAEGPVGSRLPVPRRNMPLDVASHQTHGLQVRRCRSAAGAHGVEVLSWQM